MDGDESGKATSAVGDGVSTREGACATSACATSEGKKRLNPIKLRQMQDRQQELEEEVGRVEGEIAQCESGLQSFVSAEETARLTGLLERRRLELETLVAEWEELSAALESNA
jgi:predicted nuclease with TOPRIM domain